MFIRRNRIDFVSPDEDILEEVYREFKDIANLSLRHGDIRDWMTIDGCIITPGNSFGIMDGGVDLAIAQHWNGIGAEVQSTIKRQWSAGLPVGAVVSVPLAPGSSFDGYLIYAPTMSVPCDISMTPNVYMAFHAAMRLFDQIELRNKRAVWRRIVCPMFGTGTGGMTPQFAARQMRHAWLQYPFPTDWDAANTMFPNMNDPF